MNLPDSPLHLQSIPLGNSAARERGYRIGYSQGVTAALAAARSGLSAADLDSWADAVLNWRFHKLPGPPTPPEAANVAKCNLRRLILKAQFDAIATVEAAEKAGGR